MPAPRALQPLLTPAQTAEILNISRRQLRAMQERRELPFVKVGGSVRFDPVDVRRYMDARRVTA